MFDRYYEEGSEWVPIETLSTPTRRNLRWLELERGYQFDDQARKAQFGWAPSYLIYGETPEGLEVVYERRETSGRGAGQTYLWISGKRTSLRAMGTPDLSAAKFTRDWVEARAARRRLESLEDLDVPLESFSDIELRNLDQLLRTLESPNEFVPYKSPDWEALSREDLVEFKERLEEYREKYR